MNEEGGLSATAMLIVTMPSVVLLRKGTVIGVHWRPSGVCSDVKLEVTSIPEKTGALLAVSTTATLTLMLLPGYVVILIVSAKHSCCVPLAVQFCLQKQVLREGESAFVGSPIDVLCRITLLTLVNWIAGALN